MWIPGDLPGMEVGTRELCIIVKHFFEMWHTPEIIHTVTREAAAYHVVHAAARHSFQYMNCHLYRILISCNMTAEQKLDGHRLGKLGRRAPAAVAPIIGLDQSLCNSTQVFLRKGCLTGL